MKDSKENPSNPTRSDFLEEIVSKLKQQRHKLGLTQEQVDQIMGNSDRLCSKWECGLSSPSSFNLYCWADSLGCSLKIEELNPP